jgi:hypothetical protein
MRPARSLAARITALGLAGAFAAPAAATTAPLPAAAAPASCAGAGGFAAQSGAELIRLTRLEVRPGRGRAAGDKAPSGKSGGKSDSDKTGSGTAGSGTAGSATASSDKAGVRKAGSPNAGSGNADAGKAGFGTAGEERVGRSTTPRSGDRSPADSDAARTGTAGPGLLDGPLLDKLTAAPSPGPRTVQPRKPTGPDTTGPAPSANPATADEDGGDMPAPAPTDRTEGKTTVIRDLLVGEAKTALVGTASPSAAAVTRMVNSSAKSRLSRPLVQQAPPDNPRPARRETPAAEVGPLLIDAGALTSHAKSACGTDGEATRAATTLGAAAVADHRDDALVVVPEKVESLSTTALERRAAGVRSKASASIAMRTFELLGGAVQVRVTRPPTLATSMSARVGGEVRYVPAVLEVSGEGIKKTTLSAPGDSMEMTFGDRTESGAGPAAGLLNLPIGPPLTLPEVPGVPSLGAAEPESTPAAEEPGTTVTISLGKIRQAAKGSAIAARASAVEIGITKWAYGQRKPAVALDLTIGELESAAMAADSTGGVAGAVAGRGGGLPVTGPGVGLIALGGAGLLVAGVAAVAFGLRRGRRFRA